MQGQQLHAAVFGDLRDHQRVLVARIPARAEFQRDGYIHRLHHGFENAPDQGLILEESGTGEGVADFFRRAAHVDVDDLRAPLHVVAGGLGHHVRIRPGDLHRDRLDFALVIGASAGFLAAPQQRVRSHHLGHGQTRAELLTQLSEGTVRDPGHRRDKKIIAQSARTDSHRLSRKFFWKERNFIPKHERLGKRSGALRDSQRRILLFPQRGKRAARLQGSARAPKIMRWARKRRAGGRTSSAAKPAPRASASGAREFENILTRKSVNPIPA